MKYWRIYLVIMILVFIGLVAIQISRAIFLQGLYTESLQSMNAKITENIQVIQDFENFVNTTDFSEKESAEEQIINLLDLSQEVSANQLKLSDVCQDFAQYFVITTDKVELQLSDLSGSAASKCIDMLALDYLDYVYFPDSSRELVKDSVADIKQKASEIAELKVGVVDVILDQPASTFYIMLLSLFSIYNVLISQYIQRLRSQLPKDSKKSLTLEEIQAKYASKD